MKFKFKIQQYQTDAVENTVSVFTGQPSHRVAEYRRDLGKRSQQQIDFEGETRDKVVVIYKMNILSCYLLAINLC